MLSFIIDNYILIVLIIGFAILLTNNLNVESSKENKLR